MRDATTVLLAAMCRRFACIVAMAALSACSGSQSQPAKEDASRTEPESVAVTDPEVVLGAWDVVSFEGYAPRSRVVGSTRAAYADFDADGVRLRMECNYAGRRGAVRAGVFEAAADADHMQTLMGCGADGNAREARYFTFFCLLYTSPSPRDS